MIKINFKNMLKSDLAKNIVYQRMYEVVDKFPELHAHRIIVCLSKNNSPAQPGPDEFCVSVRIKGKKFNDLILEKKGDTLYQALADVKESMLELLNRRIDKSRIKARAASRRLKQWALNGADKESA